jgi:hypothetical protein
VGLVTATVIGLAASPAHAAGLNSQIGLANKTVDVTLWVRTGVAGIPDYQCTGTDYPAQTNWAALGAPTVIKLSRTYFCTNGLNNVTGEIWTVLDYRVDGYTTGGWMMTLWVGNQRCKVGQITSNLMDRDYGLLTQDFDSQLRVGSSLTCISGPSAAVFRVTFTEGIRHIA